MEAARFEVVTAVLLKIQIWDCLTLKMKALQSFRTLGTTYPVTQDHIPVDLYLQHGSCLKCIFNFVFDSGYRSIHSKMLQDSRP
jgi:hypothetical protein